MSFIIPSRPTQPSQTHDSEVIVAESQLCRSSWSSHRWAAIATSSFSCNAMQCHATAVMDPDGYDDNPSRLQLGAHFAEATTTYNMYIVVFVLQRATSKSKGQSSSATIKNSRPTLTFRHETYMKPVTYYNAPSSICSCFCAH